MTTDLQPKNTAIDLTPGKPGQPRLYTEEERKQHNREWVRKYYKENREKCDFNNKLYKLRAKGVVEWQGIVLVPKQRGKKKIYTDEEIKQRKRHPLAILKRLTGIQQGPLRNSYPGLYDPTPVDKWQVATAVVAPVWSPGVPEEETVAIIALNRNHMKIMWQVTVTLPEGRAAIV